MNNSLWFFVLFLFFELAQSERERKLHPIVIIPGILGSIIHANGTNVESCPKRCSKIFSNKVVWGEGTELLHDFNCLACYMSSDFRDGEWHGRTGVRKFVKNYPNTDSVERLYYLKKAFETMVDEFVKEGYIRGKDVFASAYDWTELPSDEWINDTKRLIEDAYYNNAESKVVIIAHSMGGPFSYYFLRKVHESDGEWIKKFIHMYIPIAPAWGGAVKALKAILSFRLMGDFFFSHTPIFHGKPLDMIKQKGVLLGKQNEFIQQGDMDEFSVPKGARIANFARHVPTVWMLLPWEEAFGSKALALNKKTGVKYSFNELLPFIQSFATDSDKVRMMFEESQTKLKNAIGRYDWTPPVPIRIFYGKDVLTPISIKVEKEEMDKKDFDKEEAYWKAEDGLTNDGDGTVPEESLSYAGGIWTKKGDGDVLVRIYTGEDAEHLEILQNKKVIKDILEEIVVCHLCWKWDLNESHLVFALVGAAACGLLFLFGCIIVKKAC